MKLSQFQYESELRRTTGRESDVRALFELAASTCRLFDLLAGWEASRRCRVDADTFIATTCKPEELATMIDEISALLGDVLCAVSHTAERFGLSLDGIAEKAVTDIETEKRNGTDE